MSAADRAHYPLRLDDLEIVQTDITGAPIGPEPWTVPAEEVARLLDYRRHCPTIDAAVGAYNVTDRLEGLALLLRSSDPEILSIEDNISAVVHFVADTLNDLAARLQVTGEGDLRAANYYRVRVKRTVATEAAR